MPWTRVCIGLLRSGNDRVRGVCAVDRHTGSGDHRLNHSRRTVSAISTRCARIALRALSAIGTISARDTLWPLGAFRTLSTVCSVSTRRPDQRLQPILLGSHEAVLYGDLVGAGPSGAGAA